MAHTSRIQILKVNDVRKGNSKKTGNPYVMQDCETVILNPDGTVELVGVLMLPKEMLEDKAPAPGLYDAQFTLGVDQERRVVARLVSLQAVQPRNPVSKAA